MNSSRSPPLRNVVGDVLRLLQVQHNQVLTRKRAGGHGFFVVVLTVDDGSVLFFLVLFHRVPNFRPTQGQVVSTMVEPLSLSQPAFPGTLAPKAGRITTISFAHDREILLAVFDLYEPHRHFLQTIIHPRVVDNFIGDPDALGGEVAGAFRRPWLRPVPPPSKSQKPPPV